MQKCESNAMDALNTSISHVMENIDRYRKQTQDFTRKSMLPFEKLVKVMLIAVSQNKVPFQSMQYMRNYKQDHLV